MPVNSGSFCVPELRRSCKVSGCCLWKMLQGNPRVWVRCIRLKLPKIQGPSLGVPIKSIVMDWRLFMGPPIYGGPHVGSCKYGFGYLPQRVRVPNIGGSGSKNHTLNGIWGQWTFWVPWGWGHRICPSRNALYMLGSLGPNTLKCDL